jgi:hypothetical protein
VANQNPAAQAPGNVTTWVANRIEGGGERLWRFDDFPDVSMSAVAQALSRLTRSGKLQRLSKGVYYTPRQTAFGQSRPNPTAVRKLAARHKPMFPAGIAAANLLGFTTQSAGRSELATSASSLPRKLVGANTIIHTRRPEAWSRLTETDAALLDFLRRRGKTSELSPKETAQRLLALYRHPQRFERILEVAATEPPRVRAMLGAIGEALGKPPHALETLRALLNPLSRFDFGVLAALPTAEHWQARKERRA